MKELDGCLKAFEARHPEYKKMKQQITLLEKLTDIKKDNLVEIRDIYNKAYTRLQSLIEGEFLDKSEALPFLKFMRDFKEKKL